MISSGSIYEHYSGNTLCVNQDVFPVININASTVRQWVVRNNVIKLRNRGNGRSGLIKWESIEPKLRDKIKKTFGDPYQKENVDSFLNRLENDDEAAIFFAKAGLSPSKEYQHYTHSI